MGLFRLLLAFAVVIAHTNPISWLPMVSGSLAVKLFFVVSGFYMALILTKRYSHSPGAYFLNRFLRLYPLFWAALLIELARAVIFATLLDRPPSWWLAVSAVAATDLPLLFGYAGAQLSLVGIDVMHLFSWHEWSGIAWHSTEAAEQGHLRGWRPFPMSHAWTLSCEILFYALAPLLVRSRTLPLAAACLGITAVILTLHTWLDPQLATVASSFFGPLQFGYFILGILSFRLYQWVPSFFRRRNLSLALSLLLLASLFALPLVERVSYTGSLALLWLLALVGIPALFELTKSSKLDRAVGEYSYPVYLVHLSCAPLLYLAVPPDQWTSGFASAFIPVATLLISVLLSGVLNRWVAHFIEGRRDQVRAQAMAKTTPGRS